MCGIIASLSKQPTLDNIVKIKAQYAEQDHRGKEGYGFVAVKDGEVVHARSKKLEPIMTELDKLGKTTLIIFHHRIPTCNFNHPKANHPVFVTSKKNLENKYFLVHNGSIQNSDSLRKEHEDLGFKYTTEVAYKYSESGTEYGQQTDTESLAIEMARFAEGRSSRIRARGGAAILMLQVDKDNNAKNFFYFHQGNPIKWYRNQHGMFLASEAKGQDLQEEMLYQLNLSTWEVSAKPASLSTQANVGDKDVLPAIPFMRLVKSPVEEKHPLVSVSVMQEEGNVMIIPPMKHLPRPKTSYLTPFTMSEKEKSEVLGRSIRSHKALQEAKEKVELQLYGAQGDLAAYIFSFGEEENEEDYQDLCRKVDRLQFTVDNLNRQIEQVVNNTETLYARN